MNDTRCHARWVPRTAIVAGRWHHDYEHYARVLRARNEEVSTLWRPPAEPEQPTVWPWRWMMVVTFGTVALTVALLGVAGP